jgi:bifunctional DNA-binding transcriptional regulator/antitoxin component of YhaV-PrlF toxin-antitoxin module
MPRAKPATFDRFGRVLVPKALREAAGIAAGTEVEIRAEADGLRLAPRKGGVLLHRVRGILVIGGRAEGDLVGAVERSRRERRDRLAGKK